MTKKILMIAGPNGAGKTTMTHELIREGTTLLYEFVNADEIAKGLAPLHPESVAISASKLMVHRIKELLVLNKDFAFETTAAGTNFIKHLHEAKERGYEIHLTFLWLASPEEAIRRVAERVRQGGHHIPKETIIRRYYAGVKNLVRHYLSLADTANIFDNSADKMNERTIAKKHKNNEIEIKNMVTWEKIERVVHER